MKDWEVMKEFIEVEREIRKGNVYTLCVCCKFFYCNSIRNMGAIKICDECMKGIKIPTF